MNRRTFLATRSPQALNQNIEELSAKVHVFDTLIDGILTRRYIMPITVSPDCEWSIEYAKTDVFSN